MCWAEPTLIKQSGNRWQQVTIFFGGPSSPRVRCGTTSTVHQHCSFYWGEDLMSALGPSESFSHLFTSSYVVKRWWWFCLWYLKSLLCRELSRNLIKKGDKRKWCVFPRGIFLTLNIWSQNRKEREVNKHGSSSWKELCQVILSPVLLKSNWGLF